MEEPTASEQSRTASRTWSPGRDGKLSTDQSLIGPTVVIKGELSAEEDLMIMGRVEGTIDHSQSVTIHEQGSVAAEVKAEEVVIQGSVEGNVYGTRRVEIAETGKVQGNVYAQRVGVVEGATFKGLIDMGSDAEAIERRFNEASGKPAKSAPQKNVKEHKDAAQATEESARVSGSEDGAETAGEPS